MLARKCMSAGVRRNQLQNIMHWFDMAGSTTADLIGGATLTHVSTSASTSPNGRACVTGGSGAYVTSSLSRLFARGTQPFGMMCVATAGAGGIQYPMEHSSSPSGTRPLVYQVSIGTAMNVGGGSVLTGGVSDANWHVWYVEFASPRTLLYRDGVLIVVGDNGQAGAPNANSFGGCIDVQGGGGSASAGDKMAELIVSDGVQHTRAIQYQSSFLRAKWGLS